MEISNFTFTVLSLLAQLLMMDSDCWNRVPPIPMTSAISWLTAITTWENVFQINRQVFQTDCVFQQKKGRIDSRLQKGSLD